MAPGSMMDTSSSSAIVKKRHAKNRHSPEEWNQHKALIEKLYMSEDRTVEDTIQVLKDQEGFVTGERKFKMQLKEWGFEKNIRSSIMQLMLAKATKRKFDEDKDTRFRYKGRDILPDRLDHYAKRSHVKDGKRVSPTASTPSLLSYCTMRSNRSSFSASLVRAVNLNTSNASIASTVSSLHHRGRALRRSLSNLSGRKFSSSKRGNSHGSDHRSISPTDFEDMPSLSPSSKQYRDYEPNLRKYDKYARVVEGCPSCKTLFANTLKKHFTALRYHILHLDHPKVWEAAEEIIPKLSPLCRSCRGISYEFIFRVLRQAMKGYLPQGGIPWVTDLFEKLLQFCVEDDLYECSYIAFDVVNNLTNLYLDQGLLYEMEQKLLLFGTSIETEGFSDLAWFCNHLMLARIYTLQERHHDALREYGKLSTSGIEVYGVHSCFMHMMVFCCADASEKLHDYKTSTDLYRRLLMESDPTDYIIRNRTPLALLGLSNNCRYTQSNQDCKKYAYKVAEVLRRENEPSTSQSWWMLRDQTWCHLNLAVTFDRENNFEQAESYFSQVVSGYEKLERQGYSYGALAIKLDLQRHYFGRPRRIDVFEAAMPSSHDLRFSDADSHHPSTLQSILVRVIQEADGLSRFQNYQRAEHLFNEARGLLNFCKPRLKIFFAIQTAQHHRRKEEWKHVRRCLDQAVILSEEIYGPTDVCTAAFKGKLAAFSEEMEKEGLSIVASSKSMSLLTISSMSSNSTGSDEFDELEFLEDGMVWGQPPASLLRFA
ncbi:uncharacterized protein A1O9_09684 [Exophiala aquamarina CBS 119918]|uniref:Clr5 domain-containing protein n=1 Tax=Exophiala aquamarina CBS 119918 TaxID=1182545 RepID=A0A072P483_9EURO|nr:uncharacterized protein A1O9_09684 [Exophiala aquamarina CBS 119918]KEF54517.1 hypothetical protein A1O9_09684 [Exophiala aquamarina CBS 119918]